MYVFMYMCMYMYVWGLKHDKTLNCSARNDIHVIEKSLV